MKNGPVTKYDASGQVVYGKVPVDMPTQYLQGWVEFYKLKFQVNPNVLIPRPETELLVDEVIREVESGKGKGQSQIQKNLSLNTSHSALILDLATGSGCIAISIAKNLPKAQIFATDISKEALEVAKENARLNKVENRIYFLESDLLSVIASEAKPASTSLPLREASQRGEQSSSDHNPTKIASSTTSPRNDIRIDIIVTNLPYIPSDRIPHLHPSVKDWEPRQALDGGLDGFDLYRRLFAQMKEKNLIPQLFIGEIDETQSEIALQEAKKYFPEAKAEIKNDLAKKPRILKIDFTK